jgi:hypothetical protein
MTVEKCGDRTWPGAGATPVSRGARSSLPARLGLPPTTIARNLSEVAAAFLTGPRRVFGARLA